MGLLSGLARVLFGAKTGGSGRQPTGAPESGRTASSVVSVEAGWMQRSKPYFFGKAHYSPCGRWVVGLMDSNGEGRGGCRESGNGTVILLNPEGTVAHEIHTVERPFSVAVSSSGQCAVQDAKFGLKLNGDAIVIAPSGKEVFRRSYTANIYNMGISDCGNYIAVQTAGGDASNHDAHLLEVIDTRSRSVLISRNPETGWADGYAFEVSADGELLSFSVQHKDLGEFQYAPSGEFLDAIGFQDATLNKGPLTSRLYATKELFKKAPSADLAQKAIDIAEKVFDEGKSLSPEWNATVHRLAGEASEYLGHLDEALLQYDKALSLDPKVGVKRKAEALRKKIK